MSKKRFNLRRAMVALPDAEAERLIADFERAAKADGWDEGIRAYVASLGHHPLHPVPPNPYRIGKAS